jgi:hypothetical protein
MKQKPNLHQQTKYNSATQGTGKAEQMKPKVIEGKK